MAAKKPKIILDVLHGHPALQTLLISYFELAKKEDYPHTKHLTDTLDQLEAGIRDIQKQIEKEQKSVKRRAKLK